jgi:hypothetical protein
MRFGIFVGIREAVECEQDAQSKPVMAELRGVLQCKKALIQTCWGYKYLSSERKQSEPTSLERNSTYTSHSFTRSKFDFMVTSIQYRDSTSNLAMPQIGMLPGVVLVLQLSRFAKHRVASLTPPHPTIGDVRTLFSFVCTSPHYDLSFKASITVSIPSSLSN